MPRDMSSLITLAVVSTLAATSASARATWQPAASGSATAATSLAQAILVAERESAGRARKAELERHEGVEVFEIKTVAKGKSTTVLVDLSGNVVRVEGGGFLGSLFDGEDRQEEQAQLARLEAMPMTLLDAIVAAERESGGRAVEASLKSLYGQALFEVRVVKDFVRQKFMVDPASGKLVTVERSQHDDNE